MEPEDTEQDITPASNAILSTNSTMPDCPSPPELGGYKLLKYKLRWTILQNLPYKYRSAIRSRLNFIKSDRLLRPQEALVMQFIASNTTILVPRVLDVFSYKGSVFIVQEHIRGPVLEDVWSRLSSEEQRSCMTQTKDCLDQLRALRPPHTDRVQAIDGSGLAMIVRWGDPYVNGPFDNHDELHRFLQHDLFRDNPRIFPKVQEALSKVSGKKYRTVFSHGDFGPHNMIWMNGKLVFIDWEMAGWFPEYWDYVRAHFARGSFKVWWDMFKEVVDEYDDEVEVQSKIKLYIN